MPVHYFLGFQMKPHSEWKERVGPIKAPANYKKQETIDKYIAERWEELSLNPAILPLGAQVLEVAKIGLNGLDVETLEPAAFLNKIRDIPSEDWPIRLFAFDIRDRMLQLMLTVFDQGGKHFPYWLLHSAWHDEPPQRCQLIDPWRDGPTTALPREKFLKFAPTSDRNPDAWKPSTDRKGAVQSARLVRTVAEILDYV